MSRDYTILPYALILVLLSAILLLPIELIRRRSMRVVLRDREYWLLLTILTFTVFFEAINEDTIDASITLAGGILFFVLLWNLTHVAQKR